MRCQSGPSRSIGSTSIPRRGGWGHNTRWARADEPVAEGSVVHVKAGYGAVYAVRVLQLVPERLIVCEVRPRGLLVTNSFEVTPAGEARASLWINRSARIALPERAIRASVQCVQACRQIAFVLVCWILSRSDAKARPVA